MERCSAKELAEITAACEKVERAVWNPSANFTDYVKKQTAILYAKREGQVVGFALFELHLKERTLVVAANECMVLKEHHGQGLPNIFITLLVTHIQKDNRRRNFRRSYDSITFVSLTVNFKMMAAFAWYSRWLTDRDNFRPDERILAVARDYITYEKLEPLNEGDLFFTRGSFPNAVVVKPDMDPPKFVPANFQSERGDAFLFVGRASRFWFIWLMTKYIHYAYGFVFSASVLDVERMAHHPPLYVRSTPGDKP